MRKPEPIMKPQPSWVGVAQQLCNLLQENQDEMDFLREIDRKMVRFEEVALEDFISLTLSGFIKFSHATCGHLYVDGGDELFLEASTASQDGIPNSLPVSDFSHILAADQKVARLCSSKELKGKLKSFSSSQTLLILPVWHLDNKRFGVIILETQHPSTLSPFRDPNVQNFANILSGQLGLGLRLRFDEARAELLDEIRNEFFRKELEPSDCFLVLAAKAIDFLPSFGPFRLDPQPGVQMLLYNDKFPKDLTIVGTTGDEPVGTKVKIEDSVCGLLFEEPENWPIVYGDPQEDEKLRRRYKAYLGKRIRAELAVPVRMDNHILAILNLESPVSGAFKQPHVDAVVDLCDSFALIINSLHATLLKSQKRQLSVILAESSYWKDAGRIFRHNTDTRLTAIRMGASNAKNALQLGKHDEAAIALSRIEEDVVAVKKMEEEFCQEFTSYANFGRYSIREIVSRALRMLDQRVERRAREVDIDFSEAPDFLVYCTPLLSLHMYNIIDNAVFWTQKKMRKLPTHQGKVVITILPGDVPEPNQEKELNETCKVEILDNGPGISEDDKRQIFEPGRSLKPEGEKGWGYALFAARNYLNNIEGDMDIDSREGEWFKCIITLSIFNPRRHREGVIPL